MALEIVNWDRQEEKFVIRAYADRTPGSYYLYEATGEDLTRLSEVSPWINPEEMAEMRHISYQTGDGLTIHGYLTLTRGRVGKNLTVIINTNGGPWTGAKKQVVTEV